MNRTAHRRPLLMLCAIVLVLAACGSGSKSGGGGSVNVKMREYEFTLDRGEWPSGAVQVTVDNVGAIPHEMFLVRTKTVGSLPRKADGTVDKDKIAPADLVTIVPSIPAGTSQTVTVQLTSGTYVAVCNIVNADGTMHFMKGMHMIVTVK